MHENAVFEMLYLENTYWYGIFFFFYEQKNRINKLC